MLYKERRKYDYNLHSTECYRTYIRGHSGKCGMVSIDDSGILLIKKGYAWDGCSGPTIDTKTTMKAGLIHDALYQLIREGILPMSYRERADEILREVMIAEGASKFRAWYYYKAVRKFGRKSALPDMLKA